MLEIKIDDEWWVKRFHTRAGASLYMALIKWATDRYTMYLIKEPRKP